MHVFRAIDHATAMPVGQGMRLLLVSADGGLADRLARLGGTVEVEAEVYAAIAALHDDPRGWDLMVLDAGARPLDEALRLTALARVAREMLPVIVLSGEVAGQVFPEDPAAPVLLRAPASAVALRVGVEHALRGRRLWDAA